MTSLRILYVTGNDRLTKLPVELATCDSLSHIECDWTVIVEPPERVTAQGTLAILQYLMTSNGSADELPARQKEFQQTKMTSTKETVDFGVAREKKETAAINTIMDNRLAKEMVNVY